MSALSTPQRYSLFVYKRHAAIGHKWWTLHKAHREEVLTDVGIFSCCLHIEESWPPSIVERVVVL